jgi:REP element-mobilizing transposase RayT
LISCSIRYHEVATPPIPPLPNRRYTPIGGADPLVRSRPPVGRSPLENSPAPSNYAGMTFYRRRLPHFYEIDQPVFLTWRLHDSLPPNRAFPADTLNSGQAFAALDRLLDEARNGPACLRQPAIANMIAEAIHYNANVLGHYRLHAFVVMPNHVHLLATPAVPLPKLMKSLKGITARRANAILALTGSPFWQEESYDHHVRHQRKFEKIRNYIEENPVRAGLVSEASDYRWSSAAGATSGSPADQGVRPTC